MRPNSSIGNGNNRASPISTSSPPSSRASSIDSSVNGSATSSTTTFEAEISSPVSELQSTWMSSPPLNCFLAAARTASLIASITKSRSMPCSWQRASMFCAMLVLIQFCFSLNRSRGKLFCPVVSTQVSICFGQKAIGVFALAALVKFALDINLEMRLGDCVNRNQQASTGSIFKDHVALVDSNDAPSKVSLAIHRRARLNLCVSAREPLVIVPAVKPAFETGRRNLQRIREMAEILHVAHSAEMVAHVRAI